MRKNPGRQIRTYSQRLDEYLGGVPSAEQPLKLRKMRRGDIVVSIAPMGLLGKKSRSIILVPSSIFDAALAGGIHTQSVYFVPEAAYKFFVKVATPLSRKRRTPNDGR